MPNSDICFILFLLLFLMADQDTMQIIVRNTIHPCHQGLTSPGIVIFVKHMSLLTSFLLLFYLLQEFIHSKEKGC